VFEPRHDTAVVLDTDSTFHGVDRVAGDDHALSSIRSSVRLRHEHDAWWLIDASGERITSYADDDLRLSVSWKAYCFADQAERDTWFDHADDLSLEFILDTLEADLRANHDVAARPDDDAAFGRLLIDTYIRFPAPQPG
jgi:hypothetical protein